MTKPEFGRLIAALRQYEVDPSSGRAWIQRTLAERANLPQKVIANIEQGRKAHLDADTLVRLADALQLTTLERREFFALATPVASADVVRGAHDPADVLTEMLETLRALRLPAALYDPFYHIVAVNGPGRALHSAAEVQPAAAPPQPVNVNFLCLALVPHSPIRRDLHAIWDQFVRRHIHQFRVMTLRYRHTPYFQQLFAALSRYDEFRTKWAATQYDASDFCCELKRYAYGHPQYGALTYTTSMQQVLTTIGALYLSTLTPLDDDTAATFLALAQTAAQDVHCVSAWPHPALRGH